jgi:chitinase
LLITVHGWAGNIADAFTGLLGRTTDKGQNNANLVNLQVCDAEFNQYKAFIVAGFDFIDRSNWKRYNRIDRRAILADVIDTFSYRSDASVVASYQSTYAAIAELWGDFTRYAATQGVNYDFAAAWKQIIPDGLTQQVTAAQTLFSTYLAQELLFWNSAAALQVYLSTEVKDTLAELTAWQTNLNNLISLPIARMTA